MPKDPKLKGDECEAYLGHFANPKYLLKGHNDVENGRVPVSAPTGGRTSAKKKKDDGYVQAGQANPGLYNLGDAAKKFHFGKQPAKK